jgi:hypothetical protein
MKKATKQFKGILVIMISLLICSQQGVAQKVSAAKNFAGANASILWTTTGISAGITGERILVSKGNTELSLKATHVFRHKFGNLILFFLPEYKISSTETGLGLSGYLFTGKEKSNKGFFLSAGAGAMHSNWKYDDGSHSNFLRPAAEIGFGIKFRLDDKMAIRWSNDIRIASPQPERGAALITTSTLALGF